MKYNSLHNAACVAVVREQSTRVMLLIGAGTLPGCAAVGWIASQTGRSKLLRFAAVALFSFFSLIASAQAQTFDAAGDWLSTFPTTGAVAAATQATWGAGNA